MKLDKQQLAWLLYDPANAAYAMIVRTVAAPIFLAACAKGIWSDSQVTSFWSLTASGAGLAAGDHDVALQDQAIVLCTVMIVVAGIAVNVAAAAAGSTV